MIRIQNIKLNLDYTELDLKKAVGMKLHVPFEKIREIRLRKRSVDARKKEKIVFLLTLDVQVKADSEKKILQKCRNDKDISLIQDKKYKIRICQQHGNAKSSRPVVVGFGPAGMFCAYVLAKAGLRPIVLERGCPVEERMEHVRNFKTSGILNPESNIQFGEGGAGTFSDGKLNTGIKDERIRFVLETFVQCGAPDEILWQAKPHIGTDYLTQVVKQFRKLITTLGGEIRYHAKLIDFETESGGDSNSKLTNKLTKLIYLQDGERKELSTEHAVFALGHSARDTLELFHEKHPGEIRLVQKAFAMGVRIEHLQKDINRALYGKFWNHPALGAADYKLAVHLRNDRSLYTFCMCPGGEVVPASSEAGHLAINGMSNFARDSRNSNSALLVGISPADFGSEHPLAGMYLQRELEQKAFLSAGGDYTAPVIRVGDFLKHRNSTQFGAVQPSYQPRTAFVSPDAYLPDFLCETLRLGIPEMDKRIKGFANPDAILTGVESRSSSPVRILRDETCQSVGATGIYPCGEGAGYAGGITSASVDGIRCAEAIIRDLEKN